MIGLEMINPSSNEALAHDMTKHIRFTTAVLGAEPVDIGIYRPLSSRDQKLLIVFHGYERDADSYLRNARWIARALHMTVVAPRFDKERFPNWRYQRGGVRIGAHGLDLTESIVPMVTDLVDWARRDVGWPDADVVLFGHSAGAQMLSRVAAYAALPPSLRIIIANPSSYVVPSLTERVPYGFRSAGGPALQIDMLRTYLARPITIYLGDDDVGKARLLTNRAAQRQGANRLKRGRRIFKQGKRVAQANNWEFNWRLVESSGVGHSARGMLRAAEAINALAP